MLAAATVLILAAVPTSAQEVIELPVVTEEPGASMDLPGGSILTYADIVSEQPVQRLQFVLRDDSPEDGSGGAAWFREEITLTTADGRRSNQRALDGDELPFQPFLEGGFLQPGFITADGAETITITYDLDTLPAGGPGLDAVTGIEVLLLLANDYRVDVVLDGAVAAFISSPGNVMDGSNQDFHRFNIRIGAETAVRETTWARSKRHRR